MLAVEIHQTSVTSSDISFDLELIGDRRERHRGPYLQLGTPSTIVVRWRTAVASSTPRRLRHDPRRLSIRPYRRDAHHRALGDPHRPEPGTRYYYAVGTATELLAGGTADFTFVTAPPPGTRQPIRVWVLGDPGTAQRQAAPCATPT